MFVQVVTAKVVDADGLQRQSERWDNEIRPSAVGFLGGTRGVTDDGRLAVVARFESAEAAQANSERPEQQAWFAETAKCLSDINFQDSNEVLVTRDGGTDRAGFVQLMRGRVADAAKMRELLARNDEFDAVMVEHRPDVLGDITMLHPDGAFTVAIYFTSEADARANETKEMPPEIQAMFEEWMAVAPVDEFVDLKNPQFG